MTPEVGQYWRFQIPGRTRTAIPSIWLVEDVGEDDRGEGEWVSMVLVSMATAGQDSYKNVGDTLCIPIEAMEEAHGWTHIAAEDIPLLVLGDL